MSQPPKYGASTDRDESGRFVVGNSGRPKGSRNKATIAALSLLEGEAEVLTRMAISMALSGDSNALKLCLERILAPRRANPVVFDLPRLESAADATRAVSAVLESVSLGEIAANEGRLIVDIVDRYCRTLEAVEFEDRLAILESKLSKASG